jgi:hypothetical protein
MFLNCMLNITSIFFNLYYIYGGFSSIFWGSLAQVHRMVRLAGAQAAQVLIGLRAALQAHDAARVAARVRRHASESQSQQPPASIAGRAITVLASADVAGGAASACCWKHLAVPQTCLGCAVKPWRSRH